MIFKKTYFLNLDVLNKCCCDIDNPRLGIILKRLLKSINADCIYTERLDEHDEFFIPKTEEERILWENLRESAKAQIRGILTGRENGKKGGRPRKEEMAVEPEKPVEITKTPEEMERNKQKVHNALEIFGNSYRATDAVVGVFERPDGSLKQGIQIKNPRLMAFIKHRFDKRTLERVSNWTVGSNQRGRTYNASALLKLFCKFQTDIEPAINYNAVQSEYLTFEYKGENKWEQD